MESRSVAIIGSFQKYYDKIKELITLFNASGLTVTSPYKSQIIETRSIQNGSGFVVFEADDLKQSDAEIQMDTLRKILKADAVYVYDPDGYIGRTTCYEIGVLISKRKPLYFFSMPIDLPLPISPQQLKSPQEFAQLVNTRSVRCELPNNLSANGITTYNNVFGQQKHALVLCGSMKFYDLMQTLQVNMRRNGIYTIIPANEEGVEHTLTDIEFSRFKRSVSNSYLRKIRDKHTLAILVVNEEKHGEKNYIGANTLVEIGMAFTWGKKVFILNELYEPLIDELLAWECEPLYGNLISLVDYFARYGDDSAQLISEQITMFDGHLGLI